MPYVAPEQRQFLNHGNVGENVGELTYNLQQVLMQYLEGIACPVASGFREGVGRQIRYADLAECIAALEGCKADFIDRILLPYEHAKAAENGDVWHPALLDHLGIEHA